MNDDQLNTLGLRQQALLACLRLCGGDLEKMFTAEDILVEAWEKNNAAWGLRGHERDHADAEKINKELNRRGDIGLVGQGLLERVGPMVYRMTATGLHEASNLVPGDTKAREKADRELESSIKTILEHPTFKAWIVDSAKPRYFREAGHFWGIAPGTPARIVRERIASVDRVLDRAAEVLSTKQTEAVSDTHSRLLFDRRDIERCAEFQKVLKDRFKRDLRLLDPEFGLKDDSMSTHSAET